MNAIGRFRSEEHRNQRAVLAGYKFFRRRGYGRDDALQRGIAMHNRLTGAFAVMDASDWKINPLSVARDAVFSQVTM